VTRHYLVIIEQADGNLSAYSPDLPGCVATGKSRDEGRQRMAEAIAFHLDGLAADGLPIPEPRAQAEYVSVGG
jgi:predicted RNase H-like HicB family nuclease